MMERQHAYEHFLKLGIPNNFAKEMARLFDCSVDATFIVDAWDAVLHFTDWTKTPQGHDFWAEVLDAVNTDGVSAFKQFSLT